MERQGFLSPEGTWIKRTPVICPSRSGQMELRLLLPVWWPPNDGMQEWWEHRGSCGVARLQSHWCHFICATKKWSLFESSEPVCNFWVIWILITNNLLEDTYPVDGPISLIMHNQLICSVTFLSSNLWLQLIYGGFYVILSRLTEHPWVFGQFQDVTRACETLLWTYFTTVCHCTETRGNLQQLQPGTCSTMQHQPHW